MCPLKNLTCAGWFWYQCVTDSMINREAAESHTGLAAFSTIYEKQMSQNRAGSRPGLFTDILVSCSSAVSVCILKSIQWYHNCYCRSRIRAADSCLSVCLPHLCLITLIACSLQRNLDALFGFMLGLISILIKRCPRFVLLSV